MSKIDEMAQKIAMDEYEDFPQYQAPYIRGVVSGFGYCKNLLLMELKNIAAQTEDIYVLHLIDHFEKMKELEVSK